MAAPSDAIIIGGGAAGFFAAIACAERLGGHGQVTILEQAKDVLEKVRISGGGRCNVTHDCLDPKTLTKNYPRGEKSLRGSFHRFNAADTIDWFESRGVALKTEADGRMFPVSNNSESIIECLQQQARRAGVEVVTNERVKQLRHADGHFQLRTRTGTHSALSVLLATGGTRTRAGADFAAVFDHSAEPAVPSLFTFHIDDPRIKELPGLSVPHARVSVTGHRLEASGPLLITHWGMSGPAILKTSAWGARELAKQDYRFEIQIDWLVGVNDIPTQLDQLRKASGKKTIHNRSPFDSIPRRLWVALATAAGIGPDTTWSQLPGNAAKALDNELKRGVYQVSGKSLNKDEFVTCGGICLDEIDLKTMESRKQPGLFFAGEVIDVDGVTGGFNFQNAWTSGYLAGEAMAARAEQLG